jgi:hypothetical protein
MMDKLKIYVAGPMTGYEEHNFPAFDKAADYLRSFGWDVINPADHDRELGIEATDSVDQDTYHQLMRWDLHQVLDADAIAFLPGWKESKGAGHEHYVAQATGTRIGYITFDNGDTQLWWDLPTTTVIGLSGYAQAGKDTIGQHLVDNHGYTRISFADTLRDFLYKLNPVVEVHHVAGARIMEELATVVDEEGWEAAKKLVPTQTHSVRALLQRLGTDAGRAVLGEDVWVDAALKAIEPGGKYVITDVRFPNEADAVRAMGGQLWRVVRPGMAAVNAHPSEVALDGYQFDQRIDNSLAKEDLWRTVESLVKTYA